VGGRSGGEGLFHPRQGQPTPSVESTHFHAPSTELETVDLESAFAEVASKRRTRKPPRRVLRAGPPRRRAAPPLPSARCAPNVSPRAPRRS